MKSTVRRILTAGMLSCGMVLAMFEFDVCAAEAAINPISSAVVSTDSNSVLPKLDANVEADIAGLPPHRGAAKRYYHYGIKVETAGNHSEAIEYKEEALQEYRKSIELKEEDNATDFQSSAYYWGAWTAAEDLNRPLEALDILESARRVWHEDDRIYWEMARVSRMRLGDENRAQAYEKDAERLFNRDAKGYQAEERYYQYLGQLYATAGNTKKAQEMSKLAVASGEVARNRAARPVESLVSVQGVLFNRAVGDNAHQYYPGYLETIKRGYGNNKPDFWGSAHYFGYWYNTLVFKDHKYALEILYKAADIWPEEDVIYWMMARTYGIHLGDTEKAAECRKKGEDLFEKKADAYRQAFRYHFELAQRYLVVEEPGKALDECWKSIESGEEHKRFRTAIPGYNWTLSYCLDSACELGAIIAYYALGQPRVAIDILSRAFEIWPDGGMIYIDLSRYYGASIKDLPSAQRCLEKAVEIASSMPDRICYYDGIPPKRRKLLYTKYRGAKQTEWSDIMATSTELAQSYLDEIDEQAPEKADENAAKALVAIERAIDMNERNNPEGGWKDFWRFTLNSLLSRVYGNYPASRHHDTNKALAYAQKAMEAGKGATAWNKQMGSSWTASSQVGMSYYYAGDYRKAVEYLSPATYLDAQASLSLAREKLADQMSDEERSRNCKASPGDLSVSNRVDAQSAATDMLNKSLAAFGQAFSSINVQRNWVRTSESKAQVFSLKWRRILTHGIHLNLRTGHPDAALGVIESGKARVLLDLLSLCNTASTEHLLTRSEREKQLLLAQADELRGKIEAEKNVPGGTDTVSLQRSLVVVEDKAKKLAENVGNWRNEIECTRSIEALNLNDVKKLMEQSGATLVSYWDTNYVAVVSSNVFEIRPLNCPDLPRQIAAFRDAITAQSPGARGLTPEADKTQKPKADAVAPVSRELYDALIRPVEDLITTDLVFISPDSSTHFLSFQALNDGTNYFEEKHAIAYAPSASVLKYCIAKRKPATGKILALGNPNLRQAEYKLVNAEKEATELAGAFPDSRALVGNEATEKAVQLLGPDYDVVHFACHGTVDLDEPMQSCLRLSPDKDNDGYLHAGEIFDMHLNASLVTLSACESGLGKVTQGSEVLGLPRAFMFAGTPSVVASLWKVDDKATAELMKAFYGNLKTMDKAEALRQAQVSMIRQGKSPFYWAAFCLYGDYK